MPDPLEIDNPLTGKTYALPNFIQPVVPPPVNATFPQDLINCWAVVDTGVDHADGATGSEYFDQAAAICADFGSSNLFANIIQRMIAKGTVGPIEVGFLIRLTERATSGAIPPPAGDRVIEIAQEMHPRFSALEVRAGEAYASTLLQFCKPYILQELIDTIEGRGLNGFERAGFVATICAAALLGGRH